MDNPPPLLAPINACPEHACDAYQQPGDAPSKTYVERAKVFQAMPPPADWEGVFDLTSK